jgi:hypothetical protein
MNRKKTVISRSIRNLLATCLVVLVTVHSSRGQEYATGIGVRLGGLNSGLSVKHFVSSTGAVEGILSFAHRSFGITGLYEKHEPVSEAPGLSWYYGIGAHLAFFNDGGYYYHYKNRVYYADGSGNTVVVPGIDFILGMEYKFAKAPVVLGLDLKPLVDFHNGLSGYFDGALNCRFVF